MSQRGKTHRCKHQCVFCSKFLSSHETLERHLRTHTGERPYNCGLCSKSFAIASILYMHKFTHSSVKKFSCNICRMRFVSPKYLWAHKTIHATDFRYMCPFCGKRFKHPTNLSAHRRRHHPNREKGRVKDILRQVKQAKDLIRIYPSYVRIQRLTTTDVENEKRKLKQPTLKHSLKPPDNNSLQSPPSSYSCTFCGKVFKQKANSYNHIYSHIGERWHNCKFCTESFKSPSNRHNHEKRHSLYKN